MKGSFWRCWPALLVLCLAAAASAPVQGQSVRATPYNAQLRTDPDVGNVQGIQAYGRPLKTDPDQGEGFSYYVHPVAHADQVVVSGVGYQQQQQPQPKPEQQQLQLAEQNKANLTRQLQSTLQQGDAAEVDRLKGAAR